LFHSFQTARKRWPGAEGEAKASLDIAKIARSIVIRENLPMINRVNAGTWRVAASFEVFLLTARLARPRGAGFNTRCCQSGLARHRINEPANCVPRLARTPATPNVVPMNSQLACLTQAAGPTAERSSNGHVPALLTSPPDASPWRRPENLAPSTRINKQISSALSIFAVKIVWERRFENVSAGFVSPSFVIQITTKS
jgi:hypothetical protein